MRYAIALLMGGLLATAGCMEMDGFLADSEPIEEYLLPDNTIPAELIEPVSFESGGNVLHGFWVTSNGGRPGVTVLYFHGNKQHIDHYWDRVMLLHDLGVNVLIFDYRGFGRSEGEFSEKGLLEDARAALEFTLARPSVSIDSLGFYGYSLGNVASIWLASEVADPMFLVAEAAFASANSLEQGALNLALPAGWLTAGSFDNAERIRDIDTPLLLIHGEDDDFVRYRDNGRVVYANAPEPKRLELVPGAHHSDIPETMGAEAYLGLVGEWIGLAAEQPW
jgi:fermentation-respiration switch protein FrsA (DUF1100 family)